MDEQRRQDYLKLIGKLLGCACGKEEEILEAHQSLVDEDLIEGILEVPSVLEGNLGTETISERSLRIVKGIALKFNLPEYLQGQSLRPKNFEIYLEYEDLLTDLLQALSDSRGRGESFKEILYPLFLENIHSLNDTFSYVLKLWVENELLTKSDTRTYRIATDVTHFCNVLRDFASIESNKNQFCLPDIAIKGYQLLENFFHRRGFVREHAIVLASLGCAYRQRLRGDSFMNLELAIDSLERALKLASSINNSNLIAKINNNLSETYAERLK